MSGHSYIAFAAAALAAALAVAAIIGQRRSIANWSFGAGMSILALESVLAGLCFSETRPEKLATWLTLSLQGKALLPALWLCFSLSFSRGNAREFLRKSRLFLALAFALPILLAWSGGAQLLEVVPRGATGAWWLGYSGSAKILSGLLLIAAVLILMNLERTLRAAVGTMQWRIKFVVLGLGVIFGARIYTRSQALIYSGDSLAGLGIETGALLIGCAFLGVGYLRGGFGEIDIYPSRAALHTSLTVLLAGAYLFIVGVLAQFVARTGGAGNFQLQALLILIAVAVLAVLLLSQRIRQKLEEFISRHFKRPQHDFRQIWSRFTGCTANLLDPAEVSSVAARLISETFSALSVSIWLLDKREEKLVSAASTAQAAGALAELPETGEVAAGSRNRLGARTEPFDLEKAEGDCAAALRQATQPKFGHGGNRICVPLRASERHLGFIVLADRVNAVPYTVEELDLLKCIGDQIAASILNLRLNEELILGKELEAFQTISTFFVHDLKNAASTLGLMLQNLPIHFDDPAFREDALRGIGRTSERINQLISSLSAVRQKLALNCVEVDLNQLLEETVRDLDGALAVPVVKELQPVPKVVADREQLQSVVTNLLLNARDAVADNGTVTVKTLQRGEWASLSVTDDGCGMSSAFIRDSLFRPFSTTKKKGLGIGLFQSSMIIKAHGGNIQVTSDLGKGSTFSVFLPLAQETR